MFSDRKFTINLYVGYRFTKNSNERLVKKIFEDYEKFIINDKIIKTICHRGLWKEKSEQNKFASFKRSVDNDFGMKIDRDN